MKDWAEIKVGVRALMLFLLGELVVWIMAAPRYPGNHTTIASKQGVTDEVALGVMAAWYPYAYWKQEQPVQKARCS